MKAISNAKQPGPQPSNSETSEILSEWRESAAYWKKHAHTIRIMFAPITRALIKDAGINEGYSVLDVAGGAGEPSLTIAEVVGPTGSVTHTDAVAEMVAAAESEAQRRGVTNMRFRQCSADLLPFTSTSFDAVVCRLGAMFFPDPLAALREMLRVTKPGGVLALAVWHKSELNPFFYLVTDVVSRYVETPLAEPDAPGAFRFAELGALARILKDAGASDVRERLSRFQMEAPISIDEFWELRSEISSTLREKFSTISTEQATRLGEDVKDAVRKYFPKGRMSFPAQMIIVTGRKPQNHG